MTAPLKGWLSPLKDTCLTLKDAYLNLKDDCLTLRHHWRALRGTHQGTLGNSAHLSQSKAPTETTSKAPHIIQICSPLLESSNLTQNEEIHSLDYTSV